MKYSILSSILKGKWMLEPQLALSLGSFVSALLSGSTVDVDEEKKLELTFIDKNGNDNKLNASEILFEGSASLSSIFDEAPQGSCAIIPLKGSMLKEDTWCSWGTNTLSALLKSAASHKNISGAILDGDTGGGAVDSIPPFLEAISFCNDKIPVVGIGDMIASAGYYVFSHLQHVIASNDISSHWGSIGVMMSFMDIQPMWEREGVKFHTIYAPESDHKNLPFEKALKGDYDLIKSEELSPLAKKFQSDVRAARKGKINPTVTGILNGRMFFANDAKKNGLIDEIGNMELAIKRVSELSNK